MDGFEDNRGIVVLGATNRPGAIDAALIRPGRFDRVIYMPLPDAEGRAKIMQVRLASASASVNACKEDKPCMLAVDACMLLPCVLYIYRIPITTSIVAPPHDHHTTTKTRCTRATRPSTPRSTGSRSRARWAASRARVRFVFCFGERGA
jgi:hypothetical protein